MGVRRSDDVEIDTGSRVGRGLAEEARRCASRAASRLGWNSSVAMLACWLCDARSPVIKKGQQDGRPNSGGLQTMNDCSGREGHSRDTLVRIPEYVPKASFGLFSFRHDHR